MPRKQATPSLKFTIRTADGATLNGSGPCSDREGFAVYMIGCLGDKSNDTPLGKALTAYLDACEQSLKASGRG